MGYALLTAACVTGIASVYVAAWTDPIAGMPLVGLAYVLARIGAGVMQARAEGE